MKSSRTFSLACRWLCTALLCLSLSGGVISCRPPPPDYSGTGYLIVAPQDLMGGVADLVSFKASQGFQVETETLENILSTFPGADESEQVRNFLKSYAPEAPEKAFVLLVGSMDTLPMRIAHTDKDAHSISDVPSDYYYAELTCEWDADGDGFYGEWEDDLTPDICDYGVELWVGRLPWDNPQEIQDMGAAIIQYETDQSSRMKQGIGAAGTIAEPCDAAAFVQLARETYMKKSGYTGTFLYEMCPINNPDYELTQANFLGAWEQVEPGFAAWFSHGDSYYSHVGHYPHDFIGVNALPEDVRPAVAVTSGCTVGNPEVESLGRVLVREGVAAGFVGASRVTSAGTNPLTAFYTQFLMGENLVLRRQALAEAVAEAIEYYVQNETPPWNISGPAFNQNVFEFLVYGDPSIQVR